jgi:hypothetical protein
VGGRRAGATTWRGERDSEGGEALPGSGAGQGFAMASRTSREERRQAPRGQAAVGWRSLGPGGLRVSTPMAARRRRIVWTTLSSVMNAEMRISAPYGWQRWGSTSNMLRMSGTQRRRCQVSQERLTTPP